MGRKAKDLTGKRFGKLIVNEEKYYREYSYKNSMEI